MENPLGPGFESQVPQNIYLIFLQAIVCSIISVVYHTLTISTRQMAFRPNLVARNEGPSCSLVKGVYWIVKVNKAAHNWASEMLILPSN